MKNRAPQSLYTYSWIRGDMFYFRTNFILFFILVYINTTASGKMPPAHVFNFLGILWQTAKAIAESEDRATEKLYSRTHMRQVCTEPA